ncbi:MAG: efflux RND transporter permease subunit [Candidatus Coatesbacteria bacterium]|nr:efflux RND transporter permease subunit [Candidatus Coatesbacteria bacterium]
MKLASFSVNRPVAITMFILIVVLFGTVAFFQIGLDLLPDIDYPLIVVMTTYEGVAPEEIEETVTQIIEESVSRAENVKRVFSTSSEGRSMVMVEFNWDANLDFAAQDVRDRVSMMSEMLPDDAEDPLVLKYDPNDQPVLVFGVTGMGSTMELRKYLDDVLSPYLERLEGVAIAFVMGGYEREINITVDERKLKSYGLSMDDVTATLRRENVNISGGHVSRDYTEYLIRTLGEYKSLEPIGKTVVAVRDGVPIRISDIAIVEDTHKEVRNYTRLNGKDCVMVAILKQSGVNTYSVVKRVYRALDDLKDIMPPDIHLEPLLDHGIFIEATVNRTVRDALFGAGLAIVFLLLFLRRWRPTLTVAIAMPISITTAFIGMYMLDYTFNLMTLVGFALGVGMLVDNAVVVIENIFRFIEEKKGAKKAASEGASQVAMAITASTFTTIAVFLPMALIKGVAGQFSRPMALTVCLALLSSLIVATTIVPMIASLLFRRGISGYSAGSFDKPKAIYERLLRKVLHNRKKVILGVIGAFVLSILAAFGLGFEFMPSSDYPMLIMNFKLPVGTSLEQTSKVSAGVEKIMKETEGVDGVLAFVGQNEQGRGPGAEDVNAVMIFTRLDDTDKRTKTSDQIQDLIREKLPKIEGASFSFTGFGPGQAHVGADQADIAIRVFGKDLKVLRAYAERILRVVERVPGTRDADISLKEGKPELVIEIDRDKASQHGLSVRQIADYVRNAALGHVATVFRVGGDEYDMRVRFAESDRNSIEKILDIEIPTPVGAHIPLYQLAKTRLGAGPINISRENQERKATVTADVFGRDLGSVLRDIRKGLANMQLPRGYFVDYGGGAEDMRETFTALVYAFIAAVLIVYMLMAALFESFRQPFVIMFTVPLGLIGVVIGLTVFGKTISTPALMGLIILVGIVVNNAIVMIDYVNQLRRRGVDKAEALIRGAVTRFRPILITSLTTIMAMMPMAFSRSEGSEMRSPMAVAIAFGLGVAMLTTLFIIPIIYSIVERIKFRPGDLHD